LEQLYGVVEIPDAVAQEIGLPLPAWMQLHSVQDRALVQSLRLQLGAGEAEAIALSMERSAARLILDDKKARAIARQLNVAITGTFGVLLHAKDEGVLSTVRDTLDALRAAGFRASDALIQEVLKRAGE